MKCAKRSLFLVGAVTTLLVTVVAVSWATSQSSSHSNVNKAGTGSGPSVKGFGQTYGATLSGASDTQTLYSVPADPAEFILTEFCSSSVTGGVERDVTGFGGVAQTTPDHLCYSFAGLEIPGGKTITCSTGSTASPGSYFCRISGVLTGTKVP